MHGTPLVCRILTQGVHRVPPHGGHFVRDDAGVWHSQQTAGLRLLDEPRRFLRRVPGSGVNGNGLPFRPRGQDRIAAERIFEALRMFFSQPA